MVSTQTTPATLLSQITDLALYNLWANKTLNTWLKTKPVELLTQQVPSSFPTLEKTLMHIWDVEQGWLARLLGTPSKSFTWEGFDGTLEDIQEGILEGSENIVQYVQGLTDEELYEGCYFNIPYVGEHTMPRFEILQHALNHSTYHRGQLITMGRNLGFTDAPMTDYMFYILRERNAMQA